MVVGEIFMMHWPTIVTNEAFVTSKDKYKK